MSCVLLVLFSWMSCPFVNRLDNVKEKWESKKEEGVCVFPVGVVWESNKREC